MRPLVQIKIHAAVKNPLKAGYELLVVGVAEGKRPTGLSDAIDSCLDGQISRLFKLGDFTGKEKTSAVIYTHTGIASRRLLLVGLGEDKKVDAETIRKAAALAAGKAIDLKVSNVGLCLHSASVQISPAAAGQAIAEGVYFGAYRYDEYLSADLARDKNTRVFSAQIIDSSERVVRQLIGGIARGMIMGNAVNFARTLANRPANVITPASIAAEAQKMARMQRTLRCTVLGEKQMSAKKMGGILSVGQGSVNRPRLIVLEYRPSRMTSKTPVLGLVGKAITFDSGGISIKPSEGMQDMKFDKSGGMAVLGAMRAIAQLKLAVRVFGLIPAAENLPSGLAYRPGDIVTTYSGKTVEIHSTDAEGRMILCDAMVYAEQLGCQTIVDIATLTGACVVALGQKRAGLMGNDDGLIEQIKTVSKQTGERVWHLPCDDEYVELMKSKIADLKNTGGKWAGACSAAAFLSQFIKKAQWAHIDMAGVGVWGAEEGTAPGSIGFGVRMLTALAESMGCKPIKPNKEK